MQDKCILYKAAPNLVTSPLEGTTCAERLCSAPEYCPMAHPFKSISDASKCCASDPSCTASAAVSCGAASCATHPGAPVPADCHCGEQNQSVTCADGKIYDSKCAALCSLGWTAAACNHKCSCANGVAATGAHCGASGGEQCVSCSAGYYLDGNKCRLIRCTACEHGTGAMGTDCPSPGGSRCASCKSTHYLDAGVCVFDPIGTCEPAGANCYRGPENEAWLASGARWSKNRLPETPDVAVVGRSVELRGSAKQAAKQVRVSAMLIVKGGELQIQSQ